jgi:FkbM family methyltransferase
VYWSRHLRHTVRFADALETAAAVRHGFFLELGPGRALTGLALQARRLDGAATMPGPHEPQDEPRVLLEALGRLWAAGGTVDWRRGLRAGLRRVPLPTYTFERTRHWVEPRREDRAAPQPDPAPAGLLYVPVWRQLAALPSGAATVSGHWLVVPPPEAASDVGEPLAAALRAAGAVEVTVARAEGPGSWDEVLAGLRPAPGQVVHAGCAGPVPAGAPDGSAELANGLEDLLSLLQALASRAPEAAPRVTVLARGVADVLGDEPLLPERAALLGPVRVAPLELPGWRLRLIDLPPRPGFDAGRLLPLLSPAREPGPDGLPDLVAWRGERLWRQEIEAMDVAAPGPGRLRPGGVYLVTGGLGGLGSALALHLARRFGARLVLLGRRSDDEPARSEAVRAVEAAGGEALVLRADVADREALAAAVASARRRFGELHGVFHAAGHLHDAPLLARRPLDAAAVLAPKVAGARALADVLGSEELDFVALFSSVVATVGNPGQVDHAAANAVLDAWGSLRPAGGARWLSVAWDAWTDAGQAAELLASAPGTTADPLLELLRGGIASHRALPALERLVEAGASGHVVVAARHPRDLAAQVARAAAAVREMPDAWRRQLRRPYLPPRNETEEVLAGIWAHFLGLERVGADESFLELGGHSLTALQIAGHIESTMGVRIPLSVFFRTASLAEAAERLEAALLADLGAADTGVFASGPPLESFTHRFGDGLEVRTTARSDAEHIYADIFERQVYIAHGIELPPEPVVLDVGAHIGLFSLFMQRLRPRSRVFAFEPSPVAFELLEANTARHRERVRCVRCALSDRAGSARLVVYPRALGLSTLYGDAEDERALLAAVIRNQAAASERAAAEVLAHLDEVLTERLVPQLVDCEVRRLSDVLSEHRIERVDLLKIDVQKSELDVMRGLAAADWPKIRQVVVEVHDIGGRLDDLERLLAGRGFCVTRDQEALYRGTGVHLLYAVRPRAGAEEAA